MVLSLIVLFAHSPVTVLHIFAHYLAKGIYFRWLTIRGYTCTYYPGVILVVYFGYEHSLLLIMDSPVFPGQKNLDAKWKQAYSIFDSSLRPSWFVFVKW